MEENLLTKHKGIIYLSLVIITIITFYPLFLSGLGCTDDLQTYIVAKSGAAFMNAKYLAEFAGRFYYRFIHPVYCLPYLIDSPFVVKLFHHIPLVTGVVLFAMILFRLVRSKEIAFLYFLLFLVTAQASKHTSLLVTYPLFFTFSFDLLLLSFLFLIRYFEHSRKPALVTSVTLFTVGLLFHESYLLYLIIFTGAILVFSCQRQRSLKSGIRHALITALPFLVVAIAYLAVYFIYRGIHPSQYSGTTIDTKHLTVPAFFRAIWNLSLTSYPLTAFNENRNLFENRSELVTGYVPIVLNIIINARVEWFIKGICVALTGFIFLSATQKISYKVLLAGTGIGILLIFLPQVPLALTEKYLTHVAGGTKGYLTTFFSLFGTILVLALVLAWLSGLMEFNGVLKRIMVAVFAFGLFICSVLTDFNNYYVAKDIRIANLRLYAMDELMNTKAFRSIPPKSIILADHLTRTWSYCAAGLTKKDFDWSSYIFVKTKISYNSFNSYQEIPSVIPGPPRPVYCITARESRKTDEILLLLTKLRPKAPGDSVPQDYVNQVWLLYYSPFKTFSVSFRVKDEAVTRNAVIYVDYHRVINLSGKNFEMAFLNPSRNDAATFFSIQAENIDPASIRISNLVDQFTCVPYYL